MLWKEAFKAQHGHSPTSEDRQVRKAQRLAREEEPEQPSRMTLTVQLATMGKANGTTTYEESEGATVERRMFIEFSGAKPTTTLEQIRSKVTVFFGGASPLFLYA